RRRKCDLLCRRSSGGAPPASRAGGSGCDHQRGQLRDRRGQDDHRTRSDRMTARQQWLMVGGVVLALAIGLWVATRMLGDELFPVAVGSEAPAFSAATVDSPPRQIALADHRGELVLLNIWATWCGPCRQEMPSIELLHERFGEHGLKVLAVSIDNPGTEETIRSFVSELDLSIQNLHDPANTISTR